MADGMELRIEVAIMDYRGGGGGLRLSEQVMIPDAGFGDLAAILGKFHELLAEVKRVKGVPGA